MAFMITCPDCSAKLKTATALPIGRAVKCPKCQFSFEVNKRNIAETSDSKSDIRPSNGSPKAPARPAPANKLASKDAPSKSRRRDEDEEDDRPRSRRRDEDDEDRPRSRSRDEDDDDDRPRKKRRDDDDEDDRPRARRRDEDDEDDRPRKKRRDEDDEEDRPRARSRKVDDDDDRPKRHRDDDDEDEDRPRKKKKKKRKKGGGATILIISLVSLLALVGGGLLLYFLVFAGGADSEMLAYLPASTTNVEGMNFEDGMSNTAFKKQAENRFKNDMSLELARKAGMSVTDLSKVYESHGKDGEVTVIRFNKDIDKGKLSLGSELKANDKIYYKRSTELPGAANLAGAKGKQFVPKGPERFVHFPSSTMAVEASSEELMKKVLGQESGKVQLPDDLNSLVNQAASGTAWSAHLQGKEGGDGDRAKGMAMSTKFSSDSMSFEMTALFKNSDDASKAYDEGKRKMDESKGKFDEMAAKKGAGMNEDQKQALKDMLNSISVNKSGDKVTVSFSMKTKPFESEGGGDGMGGFGFGGLFP